MKKVVSLLLVLSFMLTFGSVISAEPVKDNNTVINTPDDYINWLEQQVDKVGLQSTSDYSAREVLEQFKALSKEDQQKFVDYVNDPEVTKSIFEASAAGENLSLYGGDVTVTVNNDVPKDGDFSILAADYNYGTIVVSRMLGINIIRTDTTIEWRVTGTTAKITKVLSFSANVSYNYHPGLDITVTKDSPVINSSGSRVTAAGRYAWNFLYRDLGLLIGTEVVKIWGNADGSGDSTVTRI